MRSKLQLTALFALCTMLGPLGIDTYLPSFHAIGREFGVSQVAVQQTLSVYVLAMAGTMLFYGTLSDTFGRRAVLLWASVGYCLTSLVAAFVPSIEALVAVRFAQGLMGGAGMVIVRAMVQDRYQGAEAQSMMAMVMFCFGLAPALAPIFGGWLQAHGGWRTTFYFLAGFGALLALLVWRVMPETLPADKRQPLRLGVIASNYLHALSNGQFRLMILGLGLMAGANSVYIGSAAEFIMGVLRLEETSFGWLFIPLIGGTMLGSVLTGSMAGKLPQRAQKRIGYSCLFAACVWNVGYNLAVRGLGLEPAVPWAVMPITLYSFGIALLMPILSLRILGLFPTMRGLASSLQGFTQMLFFSLMAGLIVPHLFHSGLLLAVGHALAVIGGMLVWWTSTLAKTPAAAPAG
ncbi:hypothetical protein CCO03_10050 [Comamonas serinivorans]|uniref:Bcr/CflA family efflux transporter n=1 Tax=Comamonas serinivorans TaxID=1082851 RepID=A0A1Y0ENT3_9BURK|nr:multidrug effflux MFS transporter [Comamonas serinivorans]ARU04979.1 hypothetical protein CCO03_10050 [Comamonas serinivorans]